MNKKKIRFIVNPHSGTSKKHSIEALINNYLDGSLFDKEIVYTQAPKHATELSREAAANHYEIVVAVGGDGTVNEVCSGLVHSETALAILPAGSGNGFARHLNIPLSPRLALQLIPRGNIKKVDTATLNNHTFVATAGIGLDAKVAHAFAQHGKRGMKTYVKMVLKTFRNYQEEEYIITVDGKVTHQKALLVCFANSSQYGNNAVIAPQAKMDDGLLDICVLKKIPLNAYPFVTMRLFNKSIHNSKYMQTSMGKTISIDGCIDKRDIPLLVHIDGEPLQINYPIQINIQPLSLNVMIK